ncbi:MAG TPA: AMP-dependent synthetase/ligase [Baekduia sp.]|uniref:AMP-dependent synthetase/ligase n=1 Tax=Baekduia sp. TaxID=2600305 RepID=UPI002C8D807E|nr:AMP-dependent synthetase/ligase [Baekduia sp.]HMJ36699.1 AMP-dependent synthetase/ligase [Baekduia sp.]
MSHLQDPAGAEVSRPDPLGSAATFCHAFQQTAADHATETALREPDGGESLTWAEYAARVRAIATGLAGLGLQRGETVGLMMVNRPEFHLLDAAVMHLGGIPFSIYNTSTAPQIREVLANARARVVLCEEQFLGRLREATREGTVEHLVVADRDRCPGATTLRHVQQLPPPAGFDFDERWQAVTPEDLLTVIYTSGTTGPPKGVELTHANLLCELRALDAVFPLPREGGDVVSYLPMAHVAERMLSHYMPMLLGWRTTTCPDPAGVLGVVAQVHPSWLFAVPRIWEKLKAAIEPPADEDAAIALRQRLGLDRLEAALVGAAPVGRDVLEFFHGIGIPIREMWGMTETSVICTANTPEHTRLGSVGRPLPGTEVTIAADREILVRGPLVMRGYRDDPVRTAEAIDADGWLHTGDLGSFDADGFLSIVGRKKELMISSGGKNMSPSNIEAAIKAHSPLLAQVVAIGDRRPYVTALITIDAVAAAAFAAAHGLADHAPADLIAAPAFASELAAAVERGNAVLSRVEQIKCYHVLPDDWQASSDELTPTMKLKRAAIAEKYADVIERLYA